MRSVAFLLALFQAGAAFAQHSASHQEAMQWLQRMAEAAQKLNYSGTFVYRNGSHSETSRISHTNNNGRQMEKLEVLDGSPREVIRQNDEVKCYLPENRMVIVEQRTTHRTFPALLPSSLAGLGEHYIVRHNGNARVAGFDSHILRLDPRDSWRFGHQLWIDGNTGLLLKADVFDERGESLESVAFTELRIGESVTPDVLKSKIAVTAQKDAWQIKQIKPRDLRDDANWQFRAELPGFRRLASMRRQVEREVGESHDILHWVYSDGLAALSVFISPLRGQADSAEPALQSMGAINIVKRAVDGHQVIVMGDLPAAAVQRFAEGVGMRSK